MQQAVTLHIQWRIVNKGGEGGLKGLVSRTMCLTPAGLVKPKRREEKRKKRKDRKNEGWSFSESGEKEDLGFLDRDADQETLARKKRLEDRTETSGGEIDVRKGVITLKRALPIRNWENKMSGLSEAISSSAVPSVLDRQSKGLPKIVWNFSFFRKEPFVARGKLGKDFLSFCD
ncbi:hypothetical protein TNCV_3519681 [Trichonephila clavipes]|uniref:Uncharacterized protein n=1 Tax=Trichonephila clavipes TaxID=2585209 RepID=A0A8X6T373_TRICX|nr:hypothetical protein TNCV_3519681 [Trichonephila clavipes]